MTFVDDVILPLQQKAWTDGPYRLTEREYTIFCIDQLEREVNNGGFHQFFFNTAGDFWPDVVESLLRVRAPKTAALVRDAAAEFAETPSTNRDLRQHQLESIPEETFETLDRTFLRYEEDLLALQVAYWASAK